MFAGALCRFLEGQKQESAIERVTVEPDGTIVIMLTPTVPYQPRFAGLSPERTARFTPAELQTALKNAYAGKGNPRVHDAFVKTFVGRMQESASAGSHEPSRSRLKIVAA